MSLTAPSVALRHMTYFRDRQKKSCALDGVGLEKLKTLTPLARLLYLYARVDTPDIWRDRLDRLASVQPLTRFEKLLALHLASTKTDRWKDTVLRCPIDGLQPTESMFLKACTSIYDVALYADGFAPEMYALYLLNGYQTPALQFADRNIKEAVYAYWPDHVMTHPLVQQSIALVDKDAFHALLKDSRLNAQTWDQTALETGGRIYSSLVDKASLWASLQTYEYFVSNAKTARQKEINKDLKQDKHVAKTMPHYVAVHTSEQACLMSQHDPIGFLMAMCTRKDLTTLDPGLTAFIPEAAKQLYTVLDTKQCYPSELRALVMQPTWLSLLHTYSPEEAGLWEVASGLFGDGTLSGTKDVVDHWRQAKSLQVSVLELPALIPAMNYT